MNFSFQVRSSLLMLVGAAVALSACPKVPDADPLPTPPSVVSFTASASEVKVGDMVTLAWKVENATSVKIDELKLGTLSGVDGNEGTVAVAINGDSLFVLTARNARGAADTAVVQVRAGAADGELLLTALPATIEAGQSTTLAWVAPNATSVTLTATPGGAIDVGTQTTTGSVIVSPTANTSYTLTAGVRSATTMVTVSPTVLSFTSSAEAVDAGATLTLSWSTANATGVKLSAPGRGTLAEVTDPARVAAGSFDDTLPTQVDPGSLFSYELEVTAPGVRLVRTLVVAISGKPAIQSFTAPARVRSATAGALADGGVGPQTFRLQWVTREADAVAIKANGVEFYRAPGTAVAAGSLDLSIPSAATTYELTASNARGGSVSSTTRVEVVGKPTISLSASAPTVAAGTPVTLSWTGTEVQTLSISEVGFGSILQTGATNTGTTEVTPGATATYEIVANNGFDDRATATAMVAVTDPISISIAETGVLRAGQKVTASWSVPGSSPSIVGLAHSEVDVRTTSTGFDDISSTGTRIVFPTSGNTAALIPAAFSTILFGRPVGSVINVSQNGYLTFGWLNGSNSVDEALPTAKLEPMSVAPFWESLTISGVFWQVKTVSGVQQLIVQWNASTATFQAKVYGSGQIDFEYKVMPSSPAGRAAIVGSTPDQYVQLTQSPAANLGATFFGPRASPVSVTAFGEGPLGGFLDLGTGRLLRLTTNLATVVTPLDLHVSEAMKSSPVGVQGTWAELRNTRSQPLDLSGWSFALGDGGVLPLSGAVPANGVLVVGSSTDPVLNDDAGVQVVVSNFDLTGEASLVLARAGAHDTLALSSAVTGSALTRDLGPFRYSGSTPRGATTCTSSGGYGNNGQLGTPGLDRGCGFGYAQTSVVPGYFDVSAVGTPLLGPTITSYDSQVVTLDLSAAPIPFFGATQTTVAVSSNGFVSFSPASSVSAYEYLSNDPSTSNPNALVAAFAADLTGTVGVAQIYARRTTQGEDPYAAEPHWIIQWHHFRNYSSSGDDANFQIKFFDSGAVEIHFGQMRSVNSSQYSAGSDSVTSIENPAGNQAIVINANSNTPGLQPYSAFRFVPR
jgi:hypothetical protein